MRAMRIHRYGDASEIREEDVPRPVPGPGEVLVRVEATSFNPSDLGLRRGLLRDVFPIDLPVTLGGEVAGTVVETGERVIGRAFGAAAEYVAVPARSLVAAPTAVPLAHAAVLPIAGVTAWQAVFEHAKITAGRRVLINGATGAVGQIAVQLARHAGAHVIAPARRPGADLSEVVDQVGAPVDAILHLAPVAAGGVVSLLRPGGVLVSITERVPVPGVHFVTRDDAGDLGGLVALVDAGVVQLDVLTRPLADLALVHREAEAGLLRGKTVLVIRGR
ncbi:NADPH:quinone reductase-like Zn-dependent oxidoreductase [Actinoplanes tereljensis]|uniref:NADPH:quinone reductase n=1 Tax=Paractinoplanes tereljensis TaxID=571912 RepID=A0A919NML9_9ACTN|nr:NADP-dependent oxidoreductase [Actinoplanes tereljensis]GIF21601.1 NADPH:quinone reductase [Actinoplanes tereljensis]